MKKEKSTLYISPKIEIAMVECNDIVTVSGGSQAPDNPSINPPAVNPPGGYVPDDNIIEIW